AALRAAEAAQPIDEAEAKALKAGAAAQLKAAMADLKAAERAHREALIALRAAEASADGLDQRLGALTLKAAEVEGRLRSALDALGLESEVALGPPLDAAQVAALEATRGRLERRLAVCQAQVEGARAARAAHLDRVEARLEGAEAEALEAEAARVEAALEGQRRRRLLLEGELERQREGEATHAHLIEALEEATQRKSLRDRLHSLIGVSEGDHFKRFAQILNLRELIAKANAHLERLSPRYQLAPALGDDGWPKLAFVVNDAHQAHDARPLTTLSGGETFLVSLALALSLADFRHLKMPISTLLLDEGFGTLDPETLSMAMQALEKLQASGAQIGIISHVSALIERIGARVFVEKIGAGRSRIKTNLDGVEG
ncbi:hypothetical protein KJ940_11500, partial [Myxococcota bacterium]|nr:hypothetical protein [Myxococcota bacterium]